jgi:hypothetical protein
MGWYVARMREMREAYGILVGKLEGRRPLGRPWHGWENNIRMYLREMVREGVDWIHRAQDRDQLRTFVNTFMNRLFP